MSRRARPRSLRRLFVAALASLAIAPETLAAAPATAVPAEPPTPVSTENIGLHGMAVFGGNNGLYASHLPMFHHPHDVQMVMRFHLADPRSDKQLRAALAQHAALWTFDPERFDLLRLDSRHPDLLRRFTADFFEGHFERGGHRKLNGQTVIVDEIILFRRLDPATRTASRAEYRIIGRGTEWFAFQVIDRRPGSDHLIALAAPPAPGKPVGFRTPLAGLDRPDTAALDAALKSQLGAGWRVRTDLYFETGDLR